MGKQSPDKYCYIHIGSPKTGTTALQKFFSENREVLYSKGILYPDVSLRGYGHHDIAFLLNGEYPDWATPQEHSLDHLLDDLKKAASNFSGHLLLSSENFYLFPESAALHDALQRASITPAFQPIIVVYLRRQDHAHESWYNQTIKAQGYTHTIEESIETFFDLWDYEKNLKLWCDVYGPENIRVRCYSDKLRREQGVIADFLDTVDVSIDHFSLPENKENTRINKDILEFQRMMNRLPLEPIEKRLFHKELIELTYRTQGSGLFDESPILDRNQRQALLTHYASSNAKVARDFFDREELFEDANIEEADVTPSEGLSNEKLTYILGWLLAKSNAL